MDNGLVTFEHLEQAVIAAAVLFGPRVLVALGLTVGGFVAAQWVARTSDRGLVRLDLEPPVRQLLVRIIWILVVALFAIMALENIGVQLLPLIAGVGVAGAGIALALQGVLGNLVAGLTIIFTKPFRVGEYISIAGEEGQVTEITLSSTVLGHPDLSQVVIPNRKIVGEILHNYGKIRQIEIAFAVGAGADLDAVLAAVKAILADNARCLREPAPPVMVNSLTGGVVSILAKPWVNVRDYASAASEIRKSVVETFRRQNIVLPPPLQDVRMLTDGVGSRGT